MEIVDTQWPGNITLPLLSVKTLNKLVKKRDNSNPAQPTD